MQKFVNCCDECASSNRDFYSPALPCAQHPNAAVPASHNVTFEDSAGFLHKEVLRCAKVPNLNTCTRQQLLHYFKNTYDLCDTLFSGLRSDDVFYMIPDKLRRPLIFYYGHTSVLYMNKMVLAGLLKPEHRLNPQLEKLLETGVDEMSWDDMDNDKFIWPTVKEVAEYRQHVFRLVSDLIQNGEFTLPITMDSLFWSVIMGCEHDHIHLETSAVLIRQLPISAVKRPVLWNYGPSNISPVPQNEFIEVEPGEVHLGKPKNAPSFGWDNEYGSEDVKVDSFKGSKYLITNAEFLPFVLDGGYQNQQYWINDDGDDESWRWVTFRNAKHPSFWVAPPSHSCSCGTPSWPYQKDCNLRTLTGNDFKYRAVFDIIDMPWDWPVDVNYHEAKAYCRWKGKKDGLKYRVPTEAEYHRMRAAGSVDGYPDLFEGEKIDTIFRDQLVGNINLQFCSSSPVHFFPPSRAGFYDTIGNAWEWVEDHFRALDGFEIHPLYDDFSTPCFDSFHTCILGGSWISCGELSSIYARYHFRRHFFQHLGFRLVIDDGERQKKAVNIRMVKRLNDEALLDHYGDFSTFTLPTRWEESLDPLHVVNFRKQLAEFCLSLGTARGRAIEYGSEVGRTVYELAREFENVIGVDTNNEYFRLSMILKRHGKREYQRLEEGEVMSTALARLPSVIDRARVSFFHSFESISGKFDLVLLSGLEKLANPRLLLEKAREQVATGGYLVLASTFNWQEEVTPKNNWLGGYRLNGEDLTTKSLIVRLLQKDFSPVTKDGTVVSKEVTHLIRRSRASFSVDIVTILAFQRK